MKTVARRMFSLLLFFLAVYIAVCACMFLLQRRLMYHPDIAIDSPAAYGLAKMEDIALTSRDGTRLSAWVQPAAAHFPTVVYFHGNAANHAFRAEKFIAFTHAGLGIVAVQYRGFGRSDGQPGESGIYDDARAAMRYARDVLHLKPSQIVLYGESLGSGVAIQMATEYKVAALVLEAPYTSVENRAAELYPYLPVRYLLRDKFYSERKIGSVHVPLLIFHGELDAVIPVAHGKRLYELANEPKMLITCPGVGHTDFAPVKLTEDLFAFLKANRVFD
jgi:fermentation-respiration switch protein FrsA (DUF1100 family)